MTNKKKEKIKEESGSCPICEEGQAAHFCNNCGNYVCQDCFNFGEEICSDCENK